MSTIKGQSQGVWQYITKIVFLTAAVLSFNTISSRNALAYNSLQWGTGNDFSNTGLGPVLSPVIVPVFWGNWQEGLDTDADEIRRYLDGFAGWVSGVSAPLGYEPVVRQYGVWGANILPSEYLFAGSGNIQDGDVANNIHSWQAQGLLVPNAPNTIFMVFAKGFSSYTFPGGGCAYHMQNGGTYYAVVPVDVCGFDNPVVLQSGISHELTEAMTNPAAFTGSAGWVTRENYILGEPTHWTEGADECQGADSTTPHPFDSSPLSFGVVQNFSDNTVSGCTTWTLSTSSHLGLTRTSNSQLDVFFIDASGALGHATLSQDYQWSSELISGLAPGVLLGAPAAVSPSPGRLDVFVRSFQVLHSMNALNHFSKVGTQPWTNLLLETPTQGSGMGPPSAASWGPNRIDVVVRDFDASVLHFWSGDSDNFGSDNIGGQSIGPPVVISRGNNTLDVFSLGMQANLQENSWNSSLPAHPNAWSDFHGIVFPWTNMPTLLLTPVSWGRTLSNVDFRISLYVPYLGGSGTRAATYRNDTGWPSTFCCTGTTTGNSYGALSAATSQGAPSEYIVAWESRLDAPASTPFQSYSASRTDNTGFTSDPVSIPGVFMSPPVVLYGSDGYPEVMGIGTDGCLYETWLDYWSGGPIVNGPASTGICGLQ